MDNILPPYALMCRMRTARQRKRIQKKDRDKKLIQLENRRATLWKAKKELPMVPLAEPYQKDWKRTFVLRADLAESKYALFYDELLSKINTVQYWHDKAFTKKQRRRGKKVRIPSPQALQDFSVWHWWRLKLSDAERACFHTEERWHTYARQPEIRVVFNDPWRYELKVEPNIISEARMHDCLLEQQLAEVNSYIERNHLRRPIYRLVKGRTDYWNRHKVEREWESHPFKNKPLHAILGAINH
jgi:hypothetical protein